MRKLKANNIYHHLRPIISRLIKSASSEQSEDCLNLNIFVPLEGKSVCFRFLLLDANLQASSKVVVVSVSVQTDRQTDTRAGNVNVAQSGAADKTFEL